MFHIKRLSTVGGFTSPHTGTAEGGVVCVKQEQKEVKCYCFCEIMIVDSPYIGLFHVALLSILFTSCSTPVLSWYIMWTIIYPKILVLEMQTWKMKFHLIIQTISTRKVRLLYVDLSAIFLTVILRTFIDLFGFHYRLWHIWTYWRQWRRHWFERWTCWGEWLHFMSMCMNNYMSGVPKDIYSYNLENYFSFDWSETFFLHVISSLCQVFTGWGNETISG